MSSSASTDDRAAREDLARRAAVIDVVRTRVAFARVHRTHADRPLDFRTRPYLKEMVNDPAFAGEDIMKCVQPGVSEIKLLSHLAAAACGWGVMVVFPTLDQRGRYVHNRVDRPFEFVDEYRTLLKAAPDELDNVGLKAFGAGVINFVSAETRRSFREIPVDYACIEEYDECDQENLRLVDGRMDASDFKILDRIANPTIPDFGIASFYEKGTKRQWHVECRDCRESQPLDWEANVVTVVRDAHGQEVDQELRDREWKPGCGRDIRVFCRKCGHPIDRLERDPRWAYWLDTNPGAARRSRHLNQLPVPTKTVVEIWNEFKKSEGNPGLTEVWTQERLGKPYSAPGSKLTQEILERCSRKYAIADWAPFTAGGCDVGSRLDVQLFDNPEPGVRRLVLAEKLRTFQELAEAMRRFNTERLVIDMYPEKRKVEEFQREMGMTAGGWRVWLCDFNTGNSVKAAAMINSQSDLEVDFGEDANALRVDRTWMLDRDQESYVRGKAWVPPEFARLLGGAWLEEMCAMQRVAKRKPSGEVRFAWDSTGPDHQRFASAYALLACDMLGFDRPRVEPGADLVVAYAGE